MVNLTMIKQHGFWISSRDLRSDSGSGDISSVEGKKGRYKLVESEAEGLNKLQIFNIRPSDAGMYHCYADFASTPAHKTYIHLNVIGGYLE